MAARSGEFDLIARHFAPIARRNDAALSLCDDAAVFAPPPGQELVITTDSLVADVHFRSSDEPELIARKVLRVNLSDLAAMGAKPVGVVLTTAYSPELSEEWIAAFAKGFGEDCLAYDVPLLGGDTVGTPGPAFFSVTAFGAVPAGRALRRSLARPGDLLAMTGTLGDAALGLAVLQGKVDSLSKVDRDFLCDRYWLPQPRIKTGLACRELGTRVAAMDISDGLAGDCRKICSASNVGLVIDQNNIPLSDAARLAVQRDPQLWQTVMGGGDDYELLIAGAPDDIRKLGDQVSIIGEVTDRVGHVELVGLDKKTAELAKGGFDHFSS